MSLAPSPNPAAARRSGALRGTVRVPGEMAVSLSAILLGGLAAGETRLTGLPDAPDVTAVIDAMRAMGAVIRHEGRELVLDGTGNGCLLEPGTDFHFGTGGAALGLLMGLCGTYDMPTRFTGDPRLSLGDVLAPLRRMGVQVESSPGDGLPVALHGPRTANPVTWRVPPATPDAKSAILLAALNTPGITTVVEPAATPDHTERLLRAFGAEVEERTDEDGAHHVAIRGQGHIGGRKLVIPGDPSLAAGPLVAALLVPGSDVVIESVMMNPLRNGLVATLLDMGASIERTNEREECGEEVADLRVRASDLKGIDVPADRAAAMPDDLPLLAVAASFAQGETTLSGIEPSTTGENDRLEILAGALAVYGVECTQEQKGLVIKGRPGGKGLGAATGGDGVETRSDAAIAMSMLVFGLAAEHGSRIHDSGAIGRVFPDFMEAMTGLGADMEASG